MPGPGIPFYDVVDLTLIPVRNFAIETLAADPATNTPGRFHVISASGAPKYWNAVTNSYRFLDAAYITDGTINISGIKNFDSTIRGYSLDQFAIPVASLTLGGYELKGIGTAVANTSAARLDQVQTLIANAIAGIKAFKDPVRVYLTSAVTAANMTGIPNTTVADGVTLVDGDQVWDPTGDATGGKWVVHSGAWTRPVDWTSGTALEEGTSLVVNEGTAMGGSTLRVTNTGTITVGTTNVTVQSIAKAAVLVGDNNTITVSNNTISAKLDPAGWLTSSASGLAADKTKVTGKSVPFTITGDGTATTFTITHGLTLATNQVPMVAIMDANSRIVNIGVTVNSTTQITVGFAIPPASGVKFYGSVYA